MPVTVRAFDVTAKPFAAAGEIRVSRITYAGADRSEVKEEELARWPAQCNAQGILAFPWTPPAPGQFRVRFAARDSRGSEVEANAVVWAIGEGFDVSQFRLKDLELIPGRSTYKAGDTARVLLLTTADPARALFSPDARSSALVSWRFVPVAARATVIEVPILPEHEPLLHVEATAARDGRLHVQSLSMTVGRARSELTVTLKPDRAEYRPGASGRIRVEARDAAGRPVRGELALRANDAALSAISGNEVFSLQELFSREARRYYPTEISSLGYTNKARGKLDEPQRSETWRVDDWNGYWSPEDIGLSLFGPADRRRNLRLLDAGYGERGNRLIPSYRGITFTENNSMGEPNRVIVTGSYIPTAESEGPLPVTVYTSQEVKKVGAEVGPSFASANVRSDFSDSAVWVPRIVLGEDGTAEADFTLPDSVTRWEFQACALTPETQAAMATATATATKGVLVRLQSPRFFIERDEVVLSSNAHNYLATAQRIRGELLVSADLFEPLDAAAGTKDAEGNLLLTAEADVPPGGEHRFDWPLRALRPGTAKITARALSAGESDAVLLSFPLLMHGIEKQLAQGGSFRVGAEGGRKMRFEIPAEIDPAQTRLEISFTPSLAGVLVDALPFLAGYPYGCMEQTMSRFYPTVVVAGALKKMGTDLETLGKQRRDPRREKQFGVSPVFDSAELARMTEAGLRRIQDSQREGGGWGWWSDDGASPYQTAYVLQGLHAARAGGVKVADYVYQRGFDFLESYVRREQMKPLRKRSLGDSTTQVFVAYVLGLEKTPDAESRKWLAILHAQRGELSTHGLALLALALHRAGMHPEAALVLRNLKQFVQRNDANETAWVRTPAREWWRWFNNDIETNAWGLRALTAIEPKGDLAPRLVKWLVNNRRGGSHWRSTRDTALAISRHRRIRAGLRRGRSRPHRNLDRGRRCNGDNPYHKGPPALHDELALPSGVSGAPARTPSR